MNESHHSKARKRRPRIRMTPRDDELVTALFHTRLLSQDQIAHLLFQNTTKHSPRRRLYQLLERRPGRRRPALGDFRPIRRLKVRAHPHDLAAFYLTDDGVAYVQQQLGVQGEAPPSADQVGHVHRAHLIQTNQLWVDLVSDEAPLVRRQNAAAFTWHPEGHVVMTWSEPSGSGESTVKRIIPDATLDCARTGRRLYVETEMGTHPVRRKKGTDPWRSILGKLDRYADYLGRDTPSSKSDLRPTVVFLVATARRAKSVRKAIDQHLALATRRYPQLALTTFERAARDLAPLVFGDEARPRSRPRTMPSLERDVMKAFRTGRLADVVLDQRDDSDLHVLLRTARNLRP